MQTKLGLAPLALVPPRRRCSAPAALRGSAVAPRLPPWVYAAFALARDARPCRSLPLRPVSLARGVSYAGAHAARTPL